MIRLAAVLGAVLMLAGNMAAAQSLPLLIEGAKGSLALGPGDMAAVDGEVYGNQIDLTIRLDPTAAGRLEEFTTAHAGLDVRISGCGAELLRLTVIEPIAGGILVLGGLEEAAATSLWQAVTGEKACPDAS